jgi:hypothetical protein
MTLDLPGWRMVSTGVMSRSRTIAVGLAVGAMLAMSVAGCAKEISGTPQAGPTTAPATTPGGGGSTAGDRFCATLKPSMVQQAFGVAGAKVVTGKEQSNNGVSAVSCNITAGGTAQPLLINVIAFDYSGVATATVSTVMQNAQQQLALAAHASNVQQLSGIGSSDAAFSCTITSQNGVPGMVVFAAKQLPSGVSANDVTVGGAAQPSQVIAFAKLVDAG